MDQIKQTPGVKLFNSADTVSKNSNKEYLKVLNERGVPTIPTLWIEEEKLLNRADLEEKFREIPEDWKEIVIKPTISGSGHGLHEIKRENFIHTEWIKLIRSNEKKASKRSFKNGIIMIQPKIPEISQTGELSFIFFGKKFSHARKKMPPKGDLKSQYGTRVKYEASEEQIRAVGAILDKIAPDLIHLDLLYARVDGFLEARTQKFVVVEIELIEPNLYWIASDIEGEKNLSEIEKDQEVQQGKDAALLFTKTLVSYLDQSNHE